MSDNPEALRRAIECIRALADQQAMPDDFWKAEVSALEAVLAQQAATPTGDEVAVDSVAWEGFVKDYDRYNSGDPKLPFSELRASLAAVIASARQAATPAPAEPPEHGQLDPARAVATARAALGYAQAFDGKGINWHSPEPWPHRIELAQALGWIDDLGAMVLNLADRVAAPPATPAAQPAEEVMDMALCESAACVLRIGQLYRFRPVGDCKTCADMKRAADEAYGPAPATPAAPQEEA